MTKQKLQTLINYDNDYNTQKLVEILSSEQTTLDADSLTQIAAVITKNTVNHEDDIDQNSGYIGNYSSKIKSVHDNESILLGIS